MLRKFAKPLCLIAPEFEPDRYCYPHCALTTHIGQSTHYRRLVLRRVGVCQQLRGKSSGRVGVGLDD